MSKQMENELFEANIEENSSKRFAFLNVSFNRIRFFQNARDEFQYYHVVTCTLTYDTCHIQIDG